MNIGRAVASDPFGALRRALRKTVVDPRRYRTEEGYDAARYWSDRFARHGDNLHSVGNEGLSTEANEAEYAEAGEVFRHLVAGLPAEPPITRVLEVGCGTGFYTELLTSLVPAPLVAVDITDTFFADLRRRLPDVTFLRHDVTVGVPPGPFQLAVMIDVVQHIVEETKFAAALQHMAGSLAPGGHVIVGPFYPTGGRHLYYVRRWTLDHLKRALGAVEVEHVPFRGAMLATVRR